MKVQARCRSVITVKDKDGELIEPRAIGWRTSMPGGVMEVWGLALGDRVYDGEHCVLHVTTEAQLRRRPPSGVRGRYRRRRKQLRGTRRHGRPRGRG